MKTLFKNKYFQLEFYFRGIIFGFVVDDEDDLNIVFPFLLFVIKLGSFKSKRPTNFNSRIGYDL